MANLQQNTDKAFRFDNTINLGHILTFLGFIVTIAAAWATLDKRIVVLEEGRKADISMDVAREYRSTEKFTEIRDNLVDIKRAVEKTNDKLERKQ